MLKYNSVIFGPFRHLPYPKNSEFTMVFESFVDSELKEIVKSRFKNPTKIQEEAIPLIHKGENTLVIASTGSGKTESCLLPLFDKIVSEKNKPITVLYITPLKSLNRDLLDRILWWSTKLDFEVSVRHGDTTQYERSQQVENPPNLLISTPETLQSILIGSRMREHLKNVKYVVVDEVHELVTNKRGVQLTCGLERLRNLAGRELQIIGLSATVGSPETVAKYITGDRGCKIVDVSGEKMISLKVESPQVSSGDVDLSKQSFVAPPVASRIKRIHELVSTKNSVLIFTNTRESSEVLSSRLKSIYGDPVKSEEDATYETHHSSLSKKVRIEVERKFKDKQIKSLVCTSSLELGIDVGSIDFIIQYMSPRQVAKLLQRVGRSGHSLDRISEGVVLAGDSDDCFESTVITKHALEHKVEKTGVYGKALDVLGHQIVGLTMEEYGISFDRAYEILTKAYPFKSVGQDEFFEVCRLLETLGYTWINDEDSKLPEKYQQIKQQKALDQKLGQRDLFETPQTDLQELRELEKQRIEKKAKEKKSGIVLKRRKNAWEFYYENLSTIPNIKNYRVIDITSNQAVGNLDAEFVALHATPGTNFITKGRAWKVIEKSDDKLYVEPKSGIDASIPAWEGELIPVPFEIAQGVGRLRKEILDGLDIQKKYPVNSDVFGVLERTMKAQKKWSEKIPTDKTIIFEHFPIESTHNVIIHTCFGSLVNNTLGRVIATSVRGQLGSVGLQTDPYRITLKLQTRNWEAILEALKQINTKNIEKMIEQNVFDTELFRWRFLHVAKRFGIIKKDADYGKAYIRKIVDIYSKTPAYTETMNEIKQEKMDIEKTKEVVNKIQNGDFEIIIENGPSPIGMEGMSTRYEIVAPQIPEKEILEIVKERILESQKGFVCCTCGKWETVKKVKYIKAIICPICGSRLVGIVPERYTKEAQKLIKKYLNKEKLTKEEDKWLKWTLDSAGMVITHGKDVAYVLSGRGVGIATAKRLLAKQVSEDKLIEEILEAEKKYARTRKFWS